MCAAAECLKYSQHRIGVCIGIASSCTYFAATIIYTNNSSYMARSIPPRPNTLNIVLSITMPKSSESCHDRIATKSEYKWCNSVTVCIKVNSTIFMKYRMPFASLKNNHTHRHIQNVPSAQGFLSSPQAMTIALGTGQRGSDKNTIGLMIQDKNFWPF